MEDSFFNNSSSGITVSNNGAIGTRLSCYSLTLLESLATVFRLLTIHSSTSR